MTRYHELRWSKPQITITLESPLKRLKRAHGQGRPAPLGAPVHDAWWVRELPLTGVRELQKGWRELLGYLGSPVVRADNTAVWRRESPGNSDVVRMMYFAYWLMILGGIVLWMVVGLTVQ
jgi:hypothetical protein